MLCGIKFEVLTHSLHVSVVECNFLWHTEVCKSGIRVCNTVQVCHMTFVGIGNKGIERKRQVLSV